MPISDCNEWPGAKTKAGYGSLTVRGVRLYAHRLAFEEHHGPIPEGKHVLHHCDNPACINPEHLFLGGQTENMHDAIEKGRRKGVALSDADVGVIRRLRGVKTQHEIAATFGCHQGTVSRIQRGRRRQSANL